MAVTKEISELNPKNANLSVTDLFETSVVSGGSYASKSITGQEILNSVFPYYRNFIYGYRLIPDFTSNNKTVRIKGAAPNSVYVNDSICVDSTNSYFIHTGLSLALEITITSSGVLGLDTGSAANNTRYFAYILGKSTDMTAVSCVASLSYTGVSGGLVLPAGWDIYRLVGSFKTKLLSTDITEFLQAGVSNERTCIYICDESENIIGSVTTAGTHLFDMAPFVSPLSSIANLLVNLTAQAGDNILVYTDETFDFASLPCVTAQNNINSIQAETTVGGTQTFSNLNKIIVKFNTSTGGNVARVYAKTFTESV